MYIHPAHLQSGTNRVQCSISNDEIMMGDFNINSRTNEGRSLMQAFCSVTGHHIKFESVTRGNSQLDHVLLPNDFQGATYVESWTCTQIIELLLWDVFRGFSSEIQRTMYIVESETGNSVITEANIQRINHFSFRHTRHLSVMCCKARIKCLSRFPLRCRNVWRSCGHPGREFPGNVDAVRDADTQ